jgi:hypothetical protein
VQFLALLHHVDELEFVVDVKIVYMDLVAALKRVGHRGKDAWDDMVAAEIRIANGLKQAQSADRKLLDDCTRRLAKLKRHQEDIDILLGEVSISANACMYDIAPVDPVAVSFAEDLLVNRVFSEKPTKMCNKLLHLLPYSVDFCLTCLEFVSGTHLPTLKPQI